MRFDWLKFCTRHRIPFVTAGANTARGNISVHCPDCGSADPSEHMGLSLDIRRPYWGCFRNNAHAGRNPARLIMKLLGINREAAEALVADTAPPIDSFDEMIHSLKQDPEDAPRAEFKPKTAIPAEFRRLVPDTSSQNPQKHPEFKATWPAGDAASRFGVYIAQKRKFGPDAPDAARIYRLWYALTGEQAWRLIFPVYDEQGVLFGWTGRDIRDGARIRYKAREELGKDVLMTSPRKEPAPRMVIVEGPLDFLKIDYYGRRFGIEAVATMGTAVTPAQLALLAKKQRTKDKTFTLFDKAAFIESRGLLDNLSVLRGVV